jgi:hypothetical protein
MPGDLVTSAAWRTKEKGSQCVELKVDNQSTLTLMKNLVFHDRSKHIRT